MTNTTAEQVQRGQAVRFVPFTRRNRITVWVDAVTVSEATGLTFIHGVRLNANGHQDSQAQRHAWAVQSGSQVEVQED